MAVLALVSLLLAILVGYILASSDFASGGRGMLLMVNGGLGASSFLFLAVYYTKYP